jgi:hypothetical protein
MASTPADQLIAQLEARGRGGAPARGGPTAEPSAGATGIELQDAGPQIVRITGDELSVTVPRDAEALSNVIASLDKSP